VDLVALFAQPDAWAAFVGRAGPAFEPEFACRGVGTPQGDLEGQGLEGLRELWTEWLGPWDSYVTEIEDVRPVGDAVVVLVHDRGTQRGTEVGLRTGAVWRVRDGLVSEVEFHVRRESALRAAAAR